MKRIATAIVLSVMTVVAPVATDACSIGPSRHFARPSYLDPDYEPLREWRRTYNRRTMFYQLAREYAKLDTTTISVDDSRQRAKSETDEPEFFSQYERAAELFHAQQHDSALAMFDVLRAEAIPDPYWWERLFGANEYSWVAEASSYMVARCRLIISQNRYDGYWRPVVSVDQELLQRADSSYLDYLADYPDGLYARSARNIKRKIYRLSGQQDSLDLALKQMMLDAFPSGTKNDTVSLRVIDEFLNRFQGRIDFVHDSPLLAAFGLLGKNAPKGDEIALLEERVADFDSYSELYRYVLALACYRLGRYQELLDKTPAVTPAKNTLWLSTELLRARAMIQVGDSIRARVALEQMYRVSPEGAVTLELGILLLNMGKGLELFEISSRISDYDDLRVFATFGLTDEELALGISSDSIPRATKEWLARELARRYVLSGRYRQANDLLIGTKLVPFIGARRTFAALAENAEDIAALVDLGEFLYDNYITPGFSFEGYRYYLSEQTWLADLLPRCQPCGLYPDRAGSYQPPLAYFLRAVELSMKANRRSEAEAKALHYIVLSERRGQDYDRCTWGRKRPEGAFTMTSKEAFVRLHKLYKDSYWAKETPYYY